MGGERMAQGVDRGVVDARLGEVLVHHILNGAAANRLKELGDKDAGVGSIRPRR